MNSKTVEQYLKLEKTVTFDRTEDEIDIICDRLCDMEAKMTLSELQSLEGKIPARDFHRRIKPLINGKKAEQEQPLPSVRHATRASDEYAATANA